MQVNLTASRFRVNGFPKEDEKLRAASYMERRGGNVMNTLEVLAQLIQTFNAQKEDPRRLPLYAVTVLPDNSWGNSVMTSMGPNVNMRHCITREAVFNTPSSHIIQNQITGSRTIISHNNLPEMTFEEFIEIYRALPRGGKWFHFEVGVVADHGFGILLTVLCRAATQTLLLSA